MKTMEIEMTRGKWRDLGGRWANELIYKAGRQEISSLVDGKRNNSVYNTTLTSTNNREIKMAVKLY